MAYEKLGLADGQVLRAEHLDHIENGIEKNANDLKDKIGRSDFATSVEVALRTAKESGQFDGEDGETPVFETSKTDGVTTITIMIGEETHTITINDGVATDEQVNDSIVAWLEEHPHIEIKNKTSKIGEVSLIASAWVGDASPYSQVVSIDGVTENSQVDLTPSVQQLAIFYEKDLAFVTENEDGVVTVYAIGQKPQNDYTIQVTITEVAYE